MHIDVKKLGRIEGGAGKRVRGGTRSHYNRTFTDREGKRRNTVGWEYVHVCVDDATRLAYAEVLPDERVTTAVAFLRRAVAFYRRHGIKVKAVMTDNGSAYCSALHALCCRMLGLAHLRTRPYRPQTNGKAERFIRTMLAEWAYGAIYGSSSQPHHRPHRMALALQLQTRPRLPRPQAPGSSPHRPEQPARVLQLANRL